MAWHYYKTFCAFFGTVPVQLPTEQPEQPEGKRPYRVRKSANDAASQLGANNDMDNAKCQADAHPGYQVYDRNGNLIYEPMRYTVYVIHAGDTLNIPA